MVRLSVGREGAEMELDFGAEGEGIHDRSLIVGSDRKHGK